MRRSVRADVEKFHRELDIYRSTFADLAKRRQAPSFLHRQLTFWLESARFLLNELEIWGNLGDEAKYYVTFRKVQENLDYVHELIMQLTEEQARDFDNDEDE